MVNGIFFKMVIPEIVEVYAIEDAHRFQFQMDQTATRHHVLWIVRVF